MEGDVQGRNVLFENEQRVRLVRLFQLELGFVFFQKSAEIVGLIQQPCPLLEIKRDRKTPQAIDADAAFFTHAELQRSGALGCHLLLQFSKAGFHFFISRFCHVGSSRLSYNKENQNLTREVRRKTKRLTTKRTKEHKGGSRDLAIAVIW